MVAVRRVTTPRQWHDSDLQAVVARSISDMKASSWLAEDQIKGARFRRGRALRVSWDHTPWHNSHTDASSASADEAASDAEDLKHPDAPSGHLVNGEVND
jgi:hypothetical protein